MLKYKVPIYSVRNKNSPHHVGNNDTQYYNYNIVPIIYKKLGMLYNCIEVLKLNYCFCYLIFTVTKKNRIW